MVSQSAYLIVTEALRPALLPQLEEEKRSVREDDGYGDGDFLMEKENGGADWIARTIWIEPETSRLKISQIQCKFGWSLKSS